jgi:hypothetical protein
MAELVNRETARGAERANDLIDNMMKYVKSKVDVKDTMMENVRTACGFKVQYAAG